MADVTAADVKKLRDLTGAGMMECKKALVENDGDIAKAQEALRISGAAKAAARGAEREASNGLVAAQDGALVELRAETDFVAKNADFQALAARIVAKAAEARPADAAALAATPLEDGLTVAQAIEAMSAVIGEKLELGRVAVFEGPVAVYLHKRAADLPAQVGVMVAYEGSEDAARAAAMQVAAMRASYLTREEVPADVVETERRVAAAKAKEEGKPEAALERIVEGRVNGFFKDNVLLEQDSVQESKKSVKAVLDQAGTTVTRFARFEIGS
ncbi:MAG: elongation factor Ts [Actinobacteria bacterium]|nr:elongation factor Ts [Actinomycetota bacterium]